MACPRKWDVTGRFPPPPPANACGRPGCGPSLLPVSIRLLGTPGWGQLPGAGRVQSTGPASASPQRPSLAPHLSFSLCFQAERLHRVAAAAERGSSPAQHQAQHQPRRDLLGLRRFRIVALGSPRCYASLPHAEVAAPVGGKVPPGTGALSRVRRALASPGVTQGLWAAADLSGFRGARSVFAGSENSSAAA